MRGAGVPGCGAGLARLLWSPHSDFRRATFSAGAAARESLPQRDRPGACGPSSRRGFLGGASDFGCLVPPQLGSWGPFQECHTAPRCSWPRWGNQPSQLAQASLSSDTESHVSVKASVSVPRTAGHPVGQQRHWRWLRGPWPPLLLLRPAPHPAAGNWGCISGRRRCPLCPPPSLGRGLCRPGPRGPSSGLHCVLLPCA